MGTGITCEARTPKPAAEMNPAVGKMCEPRLKSHLVEGRDREAG